MDVSNANEILLIKLLASFEDLSTKVFVEADNRHKHRVRLIKLQMLQLIYKE